MIKVLPYLPVEDLGGRPHVLVDGAPQTGTVLALSHWPQSPTARVLARDLSAEIVFAFLHASRGEVLPEPAGATATARKSRAEIRSAMSAAQRAEAVSNDHFDVDGLVSVFAMTDPDFALGHEELLVDVASCGDFGVVRSRSAARIAFAIGGIADEYATRAPPDAGIVTTPSWSGARYRAVLNRMIELIEHPEHFRQYWESDDVAFGASLEDLRAGLVRIEELRAVDLAVVTRTPGDSRAVSAGSSEDLSAPLVDEVALHSATSASRILAFNGGRCELYFRYESWVRYVSRQIPRRPDLGALAAQLSAAEPSGVRWTADGVGSLVPRMRPESNAETGLEAPVIRRIVADYLRSAPAAWDPFRRGGALMPVAIDNATSRRPQGS
jgi:hypothetical protein